jgi:hypothetical protein
MRIRSVMAALCVAALFSGMAAVPSFAKSAAMEACSAQWDGMKKAGKTEGQSWPQFWSQCSKDYAAKNGKPATPTVAAETAAKPAKKATAEVDESDTAGSGTQKKDCDAKWGAYKTKTGAHGWHDYFQFMSKCI